MRMVGTVRPERIVDREFTNLTECRFGPATVPPFYAATGRTPRLAPLATVFSPESAGARGLVYFNSVLYSSVSAENTEHPRHAAAVAEVFDQSGALTGWAVSGKTHTASEGKGWFWYEVLNTTGGDNPTAANWGVAECVGCHTSCRDFVLSNYPLR